MPLKVMTIVGTRPEIIKLSCIIQEMDRHFDHTIVHTGQNFDYELNQIFFEQLQLRKPDYFLEAAGSNPAETIGMVIAKADAVLAQVAPEAILLYGDTNSCLSVISAKRRKIPIFHMEAGNRCFDQRVPEEINRKVVDHLSDINMVHSEHARRYLLREGLPPETIIKTGSPMREVLAHYEKGIKESDVLSRLALRPQDYFVVSMHREENVDSPHHLASLLSALTHLARTFEKRLIISTHPRTRKRLEECPQKDHSPLLEFMKPLGFFDYIRLQQQALCVISDSGTLTEESSMLGFPGVMIREAHERPEGMDVGAVVMSGITEQRLLDAVRMTLKQYQAGSPLSRPIEDYEAEKVSHQVVRIIQSYTDYVGRTVWHR